MSKTTKKGSLNESLGDGLSWGRTTRDVPCASTRNQPIPFSERGVRDVPRPERKTDQAVYETRQKRPDFLLLPILMTLFIGLVVGIGTVGYISKVGWLGDGSWEGVFPGSHATSDEQSVSESGQSRFSGYEEVRIVEPVKPETDLPTELPSTMIDS